MFMSFRLKEIALFWHIKEEVLTRILKLLSGRI